MHFIGRFQGSNVPEGEQIVFWVGSNQTEECVKGLLTKETYTETKLSCTDTRLPAKALLCEVGLFVLLVSLLAFSST